MTLQHTIIFNLLYIFQSLHMWKSSSFSYALDTTTPPPLLSYSFGHNQYYQYFHASMPPEWELMIPSSCFYFHSHEHNHERYHNMPLDLHSITKTVTCNDKEFILSIRRRLLIIWFAMLLNGSLIFGTTSFNLNNCWREVWPCITYSFNSWSPKLRAPDHVSWYLRHWNPCFWYVYDSLYGL